MKSPSMRLFCASAAIMLLELICIRWVPSYIRLFGFFINFVLLGSLLGIGVGMLGTRRIPLPGYPLLLLGLMAVTTLFQYSFNIPSTQVLFYGNEHAVAGSENFILLPVIFALTALVFVPLGRLLSDLIGQFPPLQAYTLDILGSLTGIALFALAAFLSTPPVIWLAILGLVSIPIIAAKQRLLALGSFAAILVLAFIAAGGAASLSSTANPAGGQVWSPYYRIQYQPNHSVDGYTFNVNNIGHQEARPFMKRETFYFRPYDLLGMLPYKKVLIIGAGTGTDVSLALHLGAEWVDAVEIDPVLYRLGRQLNPDRPYDDPRVHVHIDDGRAFLRYSEDKYDLIIFALTDSLTLTSGYANLRLESFLFTEESMASARTHLSADGVLILYNYYREEWSIRKLAGMLETAFGEPPFATSYGALGKAAVLMAGPRLRLLNPALDKPYAEGAGIKGGSGAPLPILGQGRLSGDPAIAPATDDWPFFYMEAPGLPWPYGLSLGMIAIIAIAAVAGFAPRGTFARFTPGFFFLGAAFMLLEARSLVVFSLLFGTTWVVNAMVFFAILVSVLVAILITRRWRIRRSALLFAVLFLLLLANYFVPATSFLALDSTFLRYLAAALFAFAPVLVANLIFSAEFAGTETAAISFAYNLLGIMFGGMFEYGALMMGYQKLLLIVILFYGLAFLVNLRKTVFARAG